MNEEEDLTYEEIMEILEQELEIMRTEEDEDEETDDNEDKYEDLDFNN